MATTVLNQHLSGSHTYKSCTKGSGKIKLKRVKKHHHGWGPAAPPRGRGPRNPLRSRVRPGL